jgi:hypothetical protein
MAEPEPPLVLLIAQFAFYRFHGIAPTHNRSRTCPHRVEVRIGRLRASVERRERLPLDIDNDAISIAADFQLPTQLETQQQRKHD